MSLKSLYKEGSYYWKVDNSVKRRALKFVFSRTPLKKKVNSPVYCKIYSKRIKKISGRMEPYVLNVENTNICNARCLMCPHCVMKRKQEIMTQKNFEKIVDNVMKHEKIRFLTLVGFGEPLTDREIDKKINYVNEKYPSVRVVTSTNASLLTKEMAEKLLKLNIFKINFSLNGTRKTYNKIMGLNYDLTKRNVEYFLKRRNQLGKKYPLVNVSLEVIRENERELKKFKDYWIKKADNVLLDMPSNWAGGIDKEFARTPFVVKRWPCFMLWTYISVDVAGNFIVCCRDYESQLKLGNLLREDYSKLKKKMEVLKKRHLKFDFNMPACSDCENSFKSSLDWWED